MIGIMHIYHFRLKLILQHIRNSICTLGNRILKMYKSSAEERLGNSPKDRTRQISEHLCNILHSLMYSIAQGYSNIRMHLRQIQDATEMRLRCI